MSANQRVALYGGSFNPPGLHHRRIVEQLAKEFDLVLVVPCGFRPDKRTTNEISLVDRAIMADLAFADIPRCKVLMDDLEKGDFTTTLKQVKRYASWGEIWVVLGADLLSGGHACAVYSQWEDGQILWNTVPFVCVPMKSFEVKKDQLPPQCQILDFGLEGIQSTAIREEIVHGHKVDGYLHHRVNDYIERYGIYRGVSNVRKGSLAFDPGRPVILEFDRGNEKAVKLAKSLIPTVDPSKAQAVVSIGGDGFMLDTIRGFWRLRLPFLGLNAGHRGFLLNDVKEYPLLQHDLHDTFDVYQMPLLQVKMKLADGTERIELAFNDAWVQAEMGKTAWMQLRAGAGALIPRLVGDGLLVSTAAGSTAYARAMGAMPIMVGTPSLLVVGSNVAEPLNWRWAQVPIDAKIAIRSLDDTFPRKRPIFGFVDGRPMGEVGEMTVQVSNTATAELMFTSGYNLGRKISEIQFPPTTKV